MSTDGTRVSGSITCTDFDVSSTSETPVGLSDLPGGDLLLTVDTNSNAAENRLLRVNPNTVTIQTFATNGPYTGAAATNAGVFSSVLGQAVILDTLQNVLRSFPVGGSGDGTVITPAGEPLSGVGSGEITTLVEVGATTCDGNYERYGAGLVGSGGFEPRWTASGCAQAFQTVEIGVDSALGGASSVLLVGSTRIDFPFLGGSLLVNPFFTVGLPLGGTPGVAGDGSLSVPLTLGPPGTFDFQWLVLDVGAAQGLAFSQGFEISVAP